MCRSFLAPWFNDQGEEVYYGRNNLGVVSLNLVRIAIDAEKDVKKFWEILDQRAEVAHEGLKARITRLKDVKASVAPILYCSGAMGVKLKPDDNVIDIMKNGRSSISLGWIGMHEAIYALFDEDIKGNHEDFGLEIVKFLSEKVKLWKEEEGYGYSLYNTPGENLCYRFCALDENKYGELENITTKGYYTNSMHRTVEDPLNVFEKAKFESPYTDYTTGGFISYGEYPSMIGKEDELIAAWKEISKYQSYYGTNVPADNCFKCGYEGEFKATGEGFECPVCSNTDEDSISVVRRVVGYLSSLGSRPVNKGKHKEMQARVKHW